MAVDVEHLSEVPLFSLLDEDERRALVAALDRVELPKDSLLFRRGDPGGELYLVTEGRLEVTATDDEGNVAIVAEYGPGDVVGELSLLDGGPHTSEARAVEHSRVLSLDRAGLLELVARYPHAALDLLAVVGQRLRASDRMTRVVRNVNIEEEERLTFGQRVADKVAEFGGSWTFIFSSITVLVGWVALNVAIAARAFDPYPFILLNLVLSALAALQAPVIMMSQNRQAAKDRLRSDLDYQVDRRAELEVAHLHRKVDELQEDLRDLSARLSPNSHTHNHKGKDNCNGPD